MKFAIKIRSAFSPVTQPYGRSGSHRHGGASTPPANDAPCRFHIALSRLAFRFTTASGANVAVIFAIALLPVLSAVGCAVDYSLATRMKAKLQSAADAASVAAVSDKSPGYIAAAKMTGNGEVAAADTDALNVFNGGMRGITGYSNLQSKAVVSKTGTTLASSVDASASIPAVFMKVLGYTSFTLNVHSSATNGLPAYLDFYLMLDVSGSMGLASTNAEQTRLAAISPDNYSIYPAGCTFACHWSNQKVCWDYEQKYPTNNTCLGYTLSRNGGNANNTPVTSCLTPGTSACIQLRADAVGAAVNDLFATANNSTKVPDQFRIGLYPFIQRLYSYFPLTSSISGSVSNPGTINHAAANLAELLDDGINANLGSGGTHFENALPSMNNLIKSVGSGSSWNDTLPFVVLITDGAQNNQTQWDGSWFGSNHATTLDPSLCDAIKKRKITIAVLYIPYVPIQHPSPTFSQAEDIYANANIPYIAPALQSCASPNFFFTASAPADITAALNAMFERALLTGSPRLTN